MLHDLHGNHAEVLLGATKDATLENLRQGGNNSRLCGGPTFLMLEQRHHFTFDENRTILEYGVGVPPSGCLTHQIDHELNKSLTIKKLLPVHCAASSALCIPVGDADLLRQGDRALKHLSAQ